MAGKKRNIGLNSLEFIESAPTELIRSVFARSAENAEKTPSDLSSTDTDIDDDTLRSNLIAALNSQKPETLVSLEDTCRRIRQLAEGKGPASLDMLVGQRLMHEEVETYDAQLDPLCRSAWVFLGYAAVFEDAEAFHAARQYRDYGKMYDAFEVDTEETEQIEAAVIDEESLEAHLSKRLELPSNCTIRTVNLPKTRSHPVSVMVIVRHAGPLSSVFSHKDSGLKGTIYYRPPNEATLIWTPKLNQLEVCAQSPDVRQKVGAGFAEVVLGQDMSRKPLTWRRYDLMRFRKSLSLPIPELEGVEITQAQLVEIELRLGSWSRRLALKVGIEDDIEQIARRYLGAGDLFRRAEGFSRVVIAVRYMRPDTPKDRSLNISIGHNRSNVQSLRDPQERAIAYDLLDHWGILNAFRELDVSEASNLLPQLLALHDSPEDEISGGFLRELGLDPHRMIKAGYIERRGRQSVILIDEDDDFAEVSLSLTDNSDNLKATGLHGEDLGSRPSDDLIRYAVKRDWLEETLLKLVRPVIARPSFQALDTDLIFLGRLKVGDEELPVHFARRLTQPDTFRRLDVILRARQDLGIGLVFAAGPSPHNHLGPNVVVNISDHLSRDEAEVLSRDSLEQAYQAGRTLALGGASVALLKAGPHSAMLFIPGNPPLSIHSRDQIVVFERLIAAFNNGSPELKAGHLLEDTNARSPGDLFHAKARASIIGVYLKKGSRNGFWRLGA